MTNNILVSKIVANATSTSWSQAYSTLNLYVVMSLEMVEDVPSDKTIASSGKDILEKLQREFFALPEKKLFEIKKAVERTIEEIPSYLQHSLVLATVVDNALYVITSGPSSVLLERNGILGMPAKGQERNINSFSGFLEDNDIIFLQTEGFGKKITQNLLTELLEKTSPFELSENIAPIIHEGSAGTEAAIILYYKRILETSVQEKASEDELFEKQTPSFFQIGAYIKKLPTKLKAPHKKIFILALILILSLLFIGGIFLEKSVKIKQVSAPSQNSITPSPKKNSGSILLDANTSPNIQRIGDISFKGGQLTVVDEKLGNVLLLQNDGTLVKKIESQLEKTRAVTGDERNIYVLTDDTIVKIDKQNGKSDKIITFGGIDEREAIDTFLGNVYTLSKSEKTVEKYVPPSFQKGSYFKQDVKFTKAPISFSIDSSIWILQEDGSIRKFTKGVEDTFQIKGLTETLDMHSILYTDTDFSSLYVLDRDNKKIVVFNKTGEYQKSFNLKNIPDIQSFCVDEKDKKIFIATSRVIYSLEF